MIAIKRSVLDDIQERTKIVSGRYEIGGLLLGFRAPGSIHVFSHTTPSLGDLSEKYRFVRRSPLHQISASKAWIGSGFRCDWVGEWHTHPQTTPVPSHIDVSQWRKQTARRRSEMVYLIEGLDVRYVCRLNK
jgi:integrative and conjugative element protein (TIGR02256 family)